MYTRARAVMAVDDRSGRIWRYADSAKNESRNAETSLIVGVTEITWFPIINLEVVKYWYVGSRSDAGADKVVYERVYTREEIALILLIFRVNRRESCFSKCRYFK